MLFPAADCPSMKFNPFHMGCRIFPENQIRTSFTVVCSEPEAHDHGVFKSDVSTDVGETKHSYRLLVIGSVGPFWATLLRFISSTGRYIVDITMWMSLFFFTLTYLSSCLPQHGHHCLNMPTPFCSSSAQDYNFFIDWYFPSLGNDSRTGV